MLTAQPLGAHVPPRSGLRRIDERTELLGEACRRAVDGHPSRSAQVELADTDDVLRQDVPTPTSVGSQVALAVDDGEGPAAVLTVTDEGGHAFDVTEVRHLTELAEELGGALERLRLRERLDHAERQVQELWTDSAQAAFRTSIDGRLRHRQAGPVRGAVVDNSRRTHAEGQRRGDLEAMSRREAMLHALSRSAELLLGPSGWEEAVPRVMGSVADAAGASRISLFVNRRDGRGGIVGTPQFCWRASRATDPPAAHPSMAPLNYDALGLTAMAATLADDRCVHGLTDEFDGALRTFLETMGVRSFGAAPVMVDGQWWGALILDAAGEVKPWEQADIDVLHTTARMLGTKIERDRVHEARAKLAAIVECSTDAMITRATDGTIITWNVGAEQVYGYDATEAIGRQVAILVPRDHADDFDNIMAPVLAGQSVQAYQTQRRRADGTRIHASVTAAPIRDETGQVTAVASIERDVTADVEARRELARSNAELEQFAYVASHDLQEPLRMVTSFVQLLQRRYEDQLDDTAKSYIHFAVDGATRMQQLINDLLTFSRVATRAHRFEPVALTSLMGQVLDDLRPAIAETGATVEVGELPEVSGDAGQLRQVLQNLLSNALKFHVPGHVPHVAVRAHQEPDGSWCVSVADDGIGIDPAHADRVFLIFQRLHTREEYPGSGLGLAISRKIMERHGGSLWFESQPGQGTTFHMTLPQMLQEV